MTDAFTPQQARAIELRGELASDAAIARKLTEEFRPERPVNRSTIGRWREDVPGYAAAEVRELVSRRIGTLARIGSGLDAVIDRLVKAALDPETPTEMVVRIGQLLGGLWTRTAVTSDGSEDTGKPADEHGTVNRIRGIYGLPALPAPKTATPAPQPVSTPVSPPAATPIRGDAA